MCRHVDNIHRVSVIRAGICQFQAQLLSRRASADEGYRCALLSGLLCLSLLLKLAWIHSGERILCEPNGHCQACMYFLVWLLLLLRWSRLCL